MKHLSLVLIGLLSLSVVFLGSCKKDEAEADDVQVPENFKVDIPSSVSSSEAKNLKDGELTGGDIYGHLRTFIYVGEESAEVVEEIMQAIGQHNLSQSMSFSFESDDDGRTKNVEVIENAEYEGLSYEYMLTMTDAESESNADGGYALQVFWDIEPVKGVAVLKPYNLDREENPVENDIMYRVDYSEAGSDYEQEMTVYIAGLELPQETSLGDDRFAMETLKMFAGRKGNIIDVYGNSNHPLAWLFDENGEKGLNWAFAASADEDANISAAEVGLPPSSLDSDSRTVLLDDYSIHSVFRSELTELGYAEQLVDVYLVNANAPGYFHQGGFLSAGTSPGESYAEIESSLESLVPYNPIEVSNLTISFKTDAAL